MASWPKPPGDRWVSDEDHRRELQVASGVTAEVASAAGLWSESDPRELAKMTGIPRKLWGEEQTPALVFPYWIPGEQDPALFRVKPKRPLVFQRPDGTTELRKYVQPKGEGVRLYFPAGLKAERRRRDVNLRLLVTEGEKKTLAAEAAGFACVGLSGVSCWSAKKGRKRVLHPDWDLLSLRGRHVYVVFDSDSRTNLRGVRREEKKLAQALLGAGAIVYVVRLPSGPNGEKWGLDDFLVARGAPALRQLCLEAKPQELDTKKAAAASAPEEATATTDVGNAERLIRRHGDDLRYVPAWKSWLRWDGQRWARVTEEAVLALAIDTARSIYDEVAEAGKRGDRDAADALLAHAKKTEGASSLANMVRVARSLTGVAIEVDDLDADPWALNCRNGTLDLRTGELREHRREDLITRLAGVAYDPDAASGAWDRFVGDAVRGDEDYLRFLQASAGYALTGDTSEERMWLLQGPGGTGKSTFLEALRGVLGDYAVTAEFSTFTRRERNDHGPRPDIARLAGARLVVASEGEDSQRLSEALVKNITGGERITARFLYGSEFEFRPAFKLWLATNHDPTVRHDDTGVWRRLLHLPFRHELPEDQRDPRLKAELVDVERSGAAVLAWAVRGLTVWRQRGLVVPESIRRSTEGYRASQDVLAEFLDDKCVLRDGAACTTKELKIAYKEWRNDVGQRFAPGWQRVTARLRDEGCEYVNGWLRGRKCRFWQGIGLAGADEFQDDDGSAPAPPEHFHTSDSFSRESPPRARAHDQLTDPNCQKCESVPEQVESPRQGTSEPESPAERF